MGYHPRRSVNPKLFPPAAASIHNQFGAISLSQIRITDRIKRRKFSHESLSHGKTRVADPLRHIPRI